MSAPSASVNISYQSAPDRRTVAVNGAFGGVYSGPEVVVHLYVEQDPAAFATTQELDSHGNLVAGTENPYPQSVGTRVREIQTTLVLSPEVAIGLGGFLQAHGERAQLQYGKRNQ